MQCSCSKPSSDKNYQNPNIRQTQGERNKPSSQNYFENLFPNYIFDWKQIYLLQRIITINSYQRNFQSKTLHNMLYRFVNTKLHIFGKIDSPLCSICHSNLPLLTPQTTIFGFLAETDKYIFKIMKHLLLIFKMYIYIYKSRKGFC